jgi:glutamate synthase domain-containing protein 3
VEYTGSELGSRILVEWDVTLPSFVKIMPRDYRRVLQAQAKAAAAGREATFTELVGVAAG